MDERQSWTNGGTAHILPEERQRCTFDVEDMMHILDGTRKDTVKRRWIQDAQEDDNDSSLIVDVHAERTREENVAESMEHFMKVHDKHLKRDYRPKGQEMTFMSNSRFGKTGPLSLHFGVFSSTLRSQCSAEQKQWWVDAARQLKFIGCYAQTELGHGSNVRGLQTTAEFKPGAGPEGDGEWEMTTPTLQSMKWWSTGMYSSTHAAVYAQMILNGEHKGVHVFLVQLRDANLQCMPGIELGEIGAKLGDNDAAIGYLRMRGVRIPRRWLLEARAHVTSQGEYKKGPPVPHDKKSKTKKKKKKTGQNKKGHYVTMLKTRVALTNTAAGALAKACVIATRYSAVRKQGFKSGLSLTDTDPEHQIIDYQVQQFRLCKWISCAYALRLVARHLLEKRKAVETSGLNDLPELHASASGLKAVGCVLAADGIEDLRRACGGHGYLMSSGIAPLEADFKGPNTTAEGDYVILLLQTGRFLLKQVKNAKQGLPLPGLTKCLARLQNKDFDAVRDGKPPPPATVHDLLWCGKQSRSYMRSLFAYRTLVACKSASDAYEEVAATRGQDAARNANARLLYTTAISHVKYFTLETFIDVVEALPPASSGCAAALHKLVMMFALQDISSGEQWVGLLNADEVRLMNSAVTELCASLRDDMIGLTDAFDFSDTVLNSALGRFDGRVYESLYSTAQVSSMNKGIEFFSAVRDYVDKSFLQAGAQAQRAVIGSRL
eukprot:g5083.t1